MSDGAVVDARPVAPGTLGRLLVIDDQPINIRLMTLLLESGGYSVLPALSGPEGLSLALTEKPDVVLLDMRMPGMDGFEVLERIRLEPRLQSLPVIFLTADNDRDNMIRAFAGGATDFVSKPFVSQELLSRVRTHVELARSREASRILLAAQLDSRSAAADLGELFAEIRVAAELHAAEGTASPRLADLVASIRRAADAGLEAIRARYSGS